MSIKQKKGISLIVLVITIIVMIILATAIILTLNGSGIIGKAKEAKEVSDNATLLEAANVAVAEWEIESRLGNTSETASEYVTKKLNAQGFTDEQISKVSVSETGNIKLLNYYTDKNGDKVLIPKGFTVSSVASEQTIDNGLVVIDSYGNEFVWIPVETEFKRGSNEKYPMYFDEDEQEMLDDVEYTQMYDVDDMVASVNKYNGFFVGRYETSYDNTNKRVESVKNADSYSHTSWDDLFEKQASLYPASGSAEVVSGMMTGKQWDTIVSWMQGDPNYNKGYFDYRNEFLQEDVDSFGGIYEYLDATFAAESWTYTSINTGSVEEYKIKNIYDMAGNYAEYTIEGDDYNCQTQKARGFLTLNDGILPTWDVWTSVGATSRLVLYIK